MRSEQIKNQLEIVQGDITKLDCDCIVNAANRSLLGGGGIAEAFYGMPQELAGRDLEAPAGGSAGGPFSCKCFSARGKRGILRAENRKLYVEEDYYEYS